MEQSNEPKNKLQAAWAKTEPFRSKTSEICGKIGRVISMIWKWIYRLRGLLLAIPVGLVAFRLAIFNLNRLPQAVGIFLLESGEYQWMVGRSVAVMGPLLVTAACLFLMFISRRVVYPWLISIFSLVLPLLIYITNVFPA